MLRLPNSQKFYAQDDLIGRSSTTEEIVNLLADDSIVSDDKPTDDENEETIEEEDRKKKKDTEGLEIKTAGDDDEDEDEDEDEDDEEVDIEDDDEIDEKKLELLTPVARRVILKKYPNLFKDFPYLEAAYYRDKQFTEVFPTLEDAKTAQSNAETLQQFESDLMRGNTEKVLKTVKDIDANSFARIVDDYLPALARVDEKAYFHVLSTVVKNTIVGMVTQAKKDKNEALEAAASVLHQFVFNTSEWTPITKLAKEGDPKENEVEKERRAFNQERFDTSRTEVSTRIGNAIKSTIDQNIDPKNAMTGYVKRTASREALEQTIGVIEKDKGFKVYLDKLWQQAFDAKFSTDSIDKIRKAYLTKAKTVLPTVIKKARIEALKGLGKRTSEKLEDDELVEESGTRTSPRKKNERTAAPVRRGGQSDKEKAKSIPAGMSDLDYLMRD